MIVERIYHDEREFIVVATEIVNKNALTSNQLVEIAADSPDGVLAIQFLRADLVAGPIYLIAVAQNALNAWMGCYSHARSLSVEIVVYASAQRQISIALQTLGIEDLPHSVALIVIGEDEQNTIEHVNKIIERVGHEKTPPFEQSEERYERIMRWFGITDIEIRSIAESESLSARFDALIRCLVNKVSLVAFNT